MSNIALNRATATDNAQQDGDNCNHQQNVNQAIAGNASTEHTKVAQDPDKNKNDGDDVQQVAHDWKDERDGKEKGSVSGALYAGLFKRIYLMEK